MVIHQSHPLQYISFDRTMQDIVYKLVPNLQEGKHYDVATIPNSVNQFATICQFLHFNHIFFCHTDELARERDFYKNRNLPNPKDLPQNTDDDAFPNESHADSDYHRHDEQVNVSLECTSNNLNALKRRFLRCSSQATITHLKKFVAKKVLNGIDKYKEVSHRRSHRFISNPLRNSLISVNIVPCRWTFCVTMNCWAKIIRWNLCMWRDGDFGIHHFDCNFDQESIYE